MNLFQSIFVTLAKKLGLELAEKDVRNLDYYVTEDISITAIIAQRLATVTLLDSDINVAGNNKRAEFLNGIVQKLENEKLQNSLEIALGTGDCLIKPYTDGEHVGYDLVPSNDFAITDYIEDRIKGCFIKCDQFYKTTSTLYERMEYHRIEDGNLFIEQHAFKNGTEVPIESVDRWAHMQDIIIPNVKGMLFGRIRCPKVNRSDINSVNGVPITFGAGKVVKNSNERYNQFNQEFKDKQTIIFAGKQLNLTDRRSNLFQHVSSRSIDTDSYIKEYSPSIRETELSNGILQNFKMLELVIGINSGVLTPPTTNFATASEIKANLQMTFSFIQRLRKQVEQAITDLLEGTSYILNMNNITPIGEYDLIFNWSDSYIEDMTQRTTAMLQGEAIGAISKAEYRSYVMNEPLDVAEEKVADMETPVEGNIE